MREYGFSALTSVISEGSRSSSRIVRMAFMPAVPPPMIRCRRGISGALRARVGRIRGVALEGRDADDGLRRLEGADLHVRARDLAAQAAGAALGRDLEDFHRFFFPRPLSPASSRAMNSSSGMAAMVIPAEPPRAPSSTETREMVALSGASTMDTKSYGRSTAYCATTRAPIRPTSALTLRIHPGRSRSTLRPDSDNVLSMTYRLTAGPPSSLLAARTRASIARGFRPSRHGARGVKGVALRPAAYFRFRAAPRTPSALRRAVAAWHVACPLSRTW